MKTRKNQMFSGFKKNFRLTLILIFIVIMILVMPRLQPILLSGGIGIGKDNSLSTKLIEKDKKGNVVKTIETIKYDDGRTLWDWLSLLGVPFTLAILGYVLQQQQQKRAERLSEEQRKLAEDSTKEEVLQNYFDRLSLLLIDKNLIVLSGKSIDEINAEEKELLDSALDVIRARTLSILRRFEKDAERKTSVIKFLIETDIIAKSKLNLSGADLSGADLSGADLSGAYLLDSNLSMADLSLANLSGAYLLDTKLVRANLSEADLSLANLSEADLSEADLSLSNLSGTNFKGAYLDGVDLSSANLSGANLHGVDLSLANLSGACLDSTQNLTNSQIKVACYWEKAIYTEVQWNDKQQCWIAKDEVANQKRINEIKQDRASDPKTPPNCSKWKKQN